MQPQQEECLEAPEEEEVKVQPQEEPKPEYTKEYLRSKTVELKENYTHMKFRSCNDLNIFKVEKEFEECKKVCAFYRDKNEIEKKIMKMIKEGKDNIQILSDFDKTITPFSYLGTFCSATMGIFTGCDKISKKFQDD